MLGESVIPSLEGLERCDCLRNPVGKCDADPALAEIENQGTFLISFRPVYIYRAPTVPAVIVRTRSGVTGVRADGGQINAEQSSRLLPPLLIRRIENDLR